MGHVLGGETNYPNILGKPQAAATFLDLTDSPSSYSGQANKLVAVNSGGNALEFVDYDFIMGTYNDSITADQTLLVNYTSIVTATGTRIELSIPSSMSVGDYVRIIGAGSAGWKLDCNYEVIGYNTDLISLEYNDSLTLVCIGTDLLAIVESSKQWDYSWNWGFLDAGQYGSPGWYSTITYIDRTVEKSNEISRGTSLGRAHIGGCLGIKYAYFGGGYTTAYTSQIYHVDRTLYTANATSIGTLTVSRGYVAALSGIQYNFWTGGTNGSALNTIDYIENSLGITNAVDRGDLYTVRQDHASCQGAKYGFAISGYGGSAQWTIDILDMLLTTGNASDSGDCPTTPFQVGVAGISGVKYGFYGGDQANSNAIYYLATLRATGNALDNSDLSTGRNGLTPISGLKFGYFCGGVISSTYQTIVDVIDMTTLTSNVSAGTDLSAAKADAGGA